MATLGRRSHRGCRSSSQGSTHFGNRIFFWTSQAVYQKRFHGNKMSPLDYSSFYKNSRLLINNNGLHTKPICFSIWTVDAIGRIPKNPVRWTGHLDTENLSGLGGQMAISQTQTGTDPNRNGMASLQGYYTINFYFPYYLLGCFVGYFFFSLLLLSLLIAPRFVHDENKLEPKACSTGTKGTYHNVP